MTIIRNVTVSTLLVWTVLSAERPVAAQDWSVVGGALAGVGAGAWMGLGYLSVRARGGAYLDAPGYDSRHVVIPVLVGLTTGIGLGLYKEDRLDETVLWAAVGWASGLGVGAWVGSRIWDDPPGPWAGAIIGGAAGLLVGGIVGFVHAGEGNGGVPAMVRIPL